MELKKAPENFSPMPEHCLEWMRVTGEELAKAAARRAYEEENRKTVLASLKLKATAKTDAAKDTEARASDEFQQYLAEYERVVYEERYYHHQMVWLRDKLEAWRTKCANNRRELGAYSSGG